MSIILYCLQNLNSIQETGWRTYKTKPRALCQPDVFLIDYKGATVYFKFFPMSEWIWTFKVHTNGYGDFILNTFWFSIIIRDWRTVK